MTGYAKNLVHWLQGMFSTAGPRRYFDGPQNKPGFFYDFPFKQLTMFSVPVEFHAIMDTDMCFEIE